MKIITINLPERFLDAIERLTVIGIYPSRSEALRTALREFLTNELNFYQDIDNFDPSMIVQGTGSEDAKRKIALKKREQKLEKAIQSIKQRSRTNEFFQGSPTGLNNKPEAYSH